MQSTRGDGGLVKETLDFDSEDIVVADHDETTRVDSTDDDESDLIIVILLRERSIVFHDPFKQLYKRYEYLKLTFSIDNNKLTWLIVDKNDLQPFTARAC